MTKRVVHVEVERCGDCKPYFKDINGITYCYNETAATTTVEKETVFIDYMNVDPTELHPDCPLPLAEGAGDES